jgi:hypothetical protein
MKNFYFFIFLDEKKWQKKEIKNFKSDGILSKKKDYGI